MSSRRFYSLTLVFAICVSSLTIRGSASPLVAGAETTWDAAASGENCGDSKSSHSDETDAILETIAGCLTSRPVGVLPHWGERIASLYLRRHQNRGPPNALA